eukprot:14731399-Alexandrium_andersonii.AAC.1
MSASLVGSEMCIRDRSSGVRVPALGSPPSLNSGVHRLRPPRTLPLPVSYTHLTLPTICSV